MHRTHDHGASRRARDERNPWGVRFIIAYKWIKALATITLGAALLGSSPARLAQLHELALMVRAHANAAWSVMLAEQLVHLTGGHALRALALAGLFDGTLSFVEGWALQRRFAWSRWLVVVSTSSLVPFEIVTLVRHASAGRLALLVVNAAIVVYLIRNRIVTRTTA